MVNLQCTASNTLSFWGVYYEYSHPVMTLSVPHNLNLSLAPTWTPNPANVSIHTLFQQGVSQGFVPYRILYNFPCYYQLISFFWICTVLYVHTLSCFSQLIFTTVLWSWFFNILKLDKWTLIRTHTYDQDLTLRSWSNDVDLVPLILDLLELILW